MANNTKQHRKAVTITITVLAVLLVLSVGALVARVIYLNHINDRTATAVIPDNVMGEDVNVPTETAPSSGQLPAAENNAVAIALHRGRASDNEKFQLANMLPGDSVTRYFAVTVSHRADAVVYFAAEVTEQSRNLAEILHINVTRMETDTVLYDGTFAAMTADECGETFTATAPTDTVAYYKVDVSLPTSAGNAYQAAALTADLRWYVTDASVLGTPQTGVDGHVIPLLIVMGCALLVIILLLFTKRKERVADDADKT